MQESIDPSLPVQGISLPDTLSQKEREAVQAKLWRFLGRKTALYTIGDSTSVPVELAGELLESVVFTLEIYLKAQGLSFKALAFEDIETLYSAGLKLIEAKVEEGRRLWQAACVSAPGIENISYRDTLRNIGFFFKRYDYYFFAQKIPCDIDYQLCDPVPDTLKGVEYIIEYLRRIIVENAVLSFFERKPVIGLLTCYCPDYRGLLINLCEPVITNAIGLCLIGSSPFPLHISEKDLAELAKFFSGLTPLDGQAELFRAAGDLCRLLKITDRFAGDYVAKLAAGLYPRIAAALPAGNLRGIFLSFD